ncbi:hypothetical protein M408DRAFT_329749 [Serendipita vermifera MAFF 305830]|uniref:Secreted protein n=1 Tax=Serendipita vermifera MAFF 305830 TaxID=933852 RepID=A0A0C2WNH9_SERVB|nr:hypothetical protein M408DRAFT_329749 [Serendipita vermifera MAFF 305830]
MAVGEVIALDWLVLLVGTGGPSPNWICLRAMPTHSEDKGESERLRERFKRRLGPCSSRTTVPV